MANIDISTKACSIGPTEGLFYYIGNSTVESVNYSGDIISSYIKASYTNDIIFITFAGASTSFFDYSGAIFFTVEKGPSDITFRRWFLDLNTIALKEIKSKRYNKVGYYSFDVKGFSIEKFIRTVTVPAGSGQSYIHIDNPVNIKPDQECIIGPSTISSCLNNVTFTEVDYIDGNCVYLKMPLDNSFDGGDSIVFIGNLIVSSSTGISNTTMPTFYLLDPQTFLVKDYSVLYQIRTIASTDFNNDTLYLCSNYCLYLVDINTYEVSNTLYLYQQCNGNYKQVYNILVISSSQFYTLQKDIVSFENFGCSISSTSTYNLCFNSFLRYINAVALSFGEFSAANKVNITAKVLDQYMLPVSNVEVTFNTSDSLGNFLDNEMYTNVSGTATTIYTLGDDTLQNLVAYTDSTFAWRSNDYIYGKNFIKIYGDIVSSIVVDSYGDVDSDLVVPLYNKDVESNLLFPLTDYSIFKSTTLKSIPNIISDGHIVCYGDVLSSSTVTVDAGHSIEATGLVFNSESTYINEALHDDAVVSTFTFLHYFLPEPYSVKNSRGVVIDFLIHPSVYAFDLSSFSFKIREVNTIFNYDSGKKEISNVGTTTSIDLGGGRYAIRFVYIPNPLYKFYSRIYCYLNIYDTAPTRNLIKFKCWFDIIEDYIPPEVVSTSPVCGSTGVPKDVDVYVTLRDTGIGINPNTIRLMLDGIPVIFDTYSVVGGYSLIHHPVVNFNSGAGVSLNVRALDYNNNLMSKSCKFYIEDSNMPDIVPEDICSDIVDNRFSMYFDVYDTGGGIKFDSVKLFLDNKLAEVIVKPIIERIS